MGKLVGLLGPGVGLIEPPYHGIWMHLHDSIDPSLNFLFIITYNSIF